MTTQKRRTIRKTEPELVFLFSGKRKSGKDYVSSLLLDRIDRKLCSNIQLSGPLKKQYAKDHDLDFEKLSDSSDYKEKFRADMIRWGEEKRNKGPGYFCNLATSSNNLNKIWIITDARRKTDIDYFKRYYGDQTYTVRICADLPVRKKRGFIFTQGVDDAESECGLDEGIQWDYIIQNNDCQEQLDQDLQHLLNIVHSKISIGAVKL